jgi:ADP-ribose pyrophosphatase
MREALGQLRATEAVYDGKIFEVTRDRVLMPNGREVTMEVVRHRGSVVLLPVRADGRLVLVRQYRYVIGEWIWELPAGTIDPGETADAAARRECHEEIGEVPGAVERLGSFYPSPGFLTETMTFFRLTDLRAPERPAVPDEDEHLEPRAFSIEELDRMIQGGDIRDMKTIVGLSLIR